MNDEIKEILDKLLEYFKESNINDFGYEKDKLISYEEAQILLDYITNLQEENEKLKEIVENLTTMTVCGDRKQIKNTAQYKLDIYKSRNEKAIELIKKDREKNYDTLEKKAFYCNKTNKLLNILQGEDKDVKD